MTAPVLTPRLARENDWRIYGHCEKCRVMKMLPVDALFRRLPDRDLSEALARGKIRCSKCERPCSSLDVSRQDVGILVPVMKLAPGLTVVRHEGDGAGDVLVWTASHPNGLVTLRRQAR